MQRTGQYAQAGSRPVGGEWIRRALTTYRWPGGGGLAAGARTGGGATPTIRLAFIRTLGEAFRDAHGRTFGETFGRSRIQGWAIGGKLVFALEGTFISAFDLYGKDYDRCAPWEASQTGLLLLPSSLTWTWKAVRAQWSGETPSRNLHDKIAKDGNGREVFAGGFTSHLTSHKSIKGPTL